MVIEYTPPATSSNLKHHGTSWSCPSLLLHTEGKPKTPLFPLSPSLCLPFSCKLSSIQPWMWIRQSSLGTQFEVGLEQCWNHHGFSQGLVWGAASWDGLRFCAVTAFFSVCFLGHLRERAENQANWSGSPNSFPGLQRRHKSMWSWGKWE